MQRDTPSGRAGGESRHLLGEGAARAGGAAAAEAPDREMEEHAPTADGLIGDVADVARVDVAGTASAGGAASGGCRRFEVERCCGKRGGAHAQAEEMG